MITPRLGCVEALVAVVELTRVHIDHLTRASLPEIVVVPDTGSIFATCEDPREEEQVGCVLWCISDGLAIGEL